MNFPIKQFEGSLPQKTVMKGEVYWRTGSVKEIYKDERGHYIASVLGQDLYQVKLTMEGQIVKHHSCSCPHKRKYVCHHIVAALYEIENGFVEERKKPVKSYNSSRKTWHQLKGLLTSLFPFSF